MKRRILLLSVIMAAAFSFSSFAGEVAAEETELVEMETEDSAEPVIPDIDLADFVTIEDEEYKNIVIQVEPMVEVTDEEVNAWIEKQYYNHENVDTDIAMPELTDELASKITDGVYVTAAEYIEAVRSNLQKTNEVEYTNSIVFAIGKKLNELYKVETIPEEYVDYLIELFLAKVIRPYANKYGITMEEYINEMYGMTEQELREQQLRPLAKENAVTTIILSSIAEKEGLTMTDEELNERLQETADAQGITAEELAESLDWEAFRSDELLQKAFDTVMETTKVEEVAAE